MPSIARTPTTAGKLYKDVGINAARKTIVQRCQITAASSYFSLANQLPAACALVWASLKIATGSLTLANSASTGTDALCDEVALVAGVPTTSGTNSVTTGVIAHSGTTLANGTEWRLSQANMTYKENVTTSPVTLALIPTDWAGSQDYNVNTTPSNGYQFGSVSAEIDVVVVYDVFRDPDSLLEAA